MMTRCTRWLTVGVCTASLLGPALAQKPNVRNRQKVQQARIVQGVKNGSLTRSEARRLEKNQVRIHRSIVRDRHDGGEFTSRERLKAQQRLNQQSRSIHHQKHDAQTRD